MQSRQDAINNAPFNWQVVSNDGTNIVANNRVTGVSFSGTLAAFAAKVFDPAYPDTAFVRKTFWASGQLFWLPPGDGGANGLIFTGNNTGAFTLSAALAAGLTVPQLWIYLTANAGGSGNVAGWYYATMSDDTHGIVFNNVYDSTSGALPVIPASPTNLNCVSATRLTTTTADTQMFQLPVNFATEMGLNGTLHLAFRTFGNNLSSNKSLSLRAGTSLLYQEIPTTASIQDSIAAISNCGSLSKQVVTRQSQSIGAAKNSTIYNDFRTVNLAAESTLNVGIKLLAATDSFMIAIRDLSIVFGP